MVKLVIKSAAQSVEDFMLDCEITWTISQVKEKITELYPTKPKKEHQKLIYGGKLLPDHLALKSILNQIQDVHTFHLVCPLPSSPSASSSTENQSISSQKSDPPVYAAPLQSNLNNVYPQLNEHIAPTFPREIPGAYSGIAYSSNPDATQQYLAMQQMYTQMMSQYLAQMNGNIPYGPVLVNPPPVQPSPPTIARRNTPPHLPRQNDIAERDYIDYLYGFSRVTMLVALLLYYSSVTRVAAVLVMILLITMFAKINRQRQREERQRASERQATENIVEQSAGDSQAAENEQVSENSSEDVLAEAVNTNQPNTSVPTTIFTLVTAFFSSLIPSDPLPVNVN